MIILTILGTILVSIICLILIAALMLALVLTAGYVIISCITGIGNTIKNSKNS